MSMRRTVVIAGGLLMAMIVVCGPRATYAKGRDLTVFPHQAAWGETVYLDGFNWPGQEVAIRARFAPTQAGLAAVPLDTVVLTAHVAGNATFLEALVLDGIPGGRSGPGWVEFEARSGEDRAGALLVVTEGARRPEGAGFIEGRAMMAPSSDGPVTTSTSPPSTRNTLIGVAPASDPSAIRLHYRLADSGRAWEFYRTDYLADGDWLVGILDRNTTQGLVALGTDIVPRRVRVMEFGEELLWYSRPVRIRNGHPVAGVDFVLMRSGTAARVAAPVAPLALPRTGVDVPADDRSWTGGVMVLAPAMGLLVASLVLCRGVMCERCLHTYTEQRALGDLIDSIK
jgi:hypothetical protein